MNNINATQESREIHLNTIQEGLGRCQGVAQEFSVRSIKSKQTYDWLLNKHYARRIPMICYSFGLYKDDLEGICTFGLGGNINNNKFSNYDMIELNRLVINSRLGKNVLSFFIAKCFKLLPKPIVIISYADEKHNHSGYIYQATNWLYTGLSSMERTIIKNDKEYHRKSLFDTYGTSSIEYLKYKGYEILEANAKHRYLYFLGNKAQKKDMLKNLKYEIKPYPKGKNIRYDASYKPIIQRELFTTI